MRLNIRNKSFFHLRKIFIHQIIEKDYQEIIKEYEEYDGEPKENKMTKTVVEMFRKYGQEIDYPTKEQIKDMANDYWVIPTPKNSKR